MSYLTGLFRCALMLLMLSAAQGFAAITEIAATTAISSNATALAIAVPVPAGTVSGDVLIAQIAASKASETITAPAGWTAIRSNSQTLLSAGMTQAIFYRVAGASEPASYSFSLSSATWVAGSMITFRGVDNSSPIFGHSGAGGVLLLSTIPAIASCPAGTMQVALFGFNTGALGLTIGAGITPYATTTTNPVLGVTILNGGKLLASAGSCPSLTTLAVSVTANVGQQVALNPAVPPVTIHHFELNPPITGLTCKPANITIKACMDAACSSVYNGAVLVTLSPLTGWTNGVAQTLISGTGTYPFQPMSPGSYTLSVSSSTPAFSNTTTCPSGGNGSCTIQVYDSGLVFNPPSYTLPNMVAGINSSTITVAALGADPATQQCVPSFANVSRVVSFWAAYTNPNSGSKAVSLTANPAGVASTAALGGSAPGTPFVLAFNGSGQAQIRLNYADVGQLSLNAAYTGTLLNGDLGLSMSGSGSIVVKPYTLVLSNIKRTSTGAAPPSNPTTASSPLFARAGDALTMTVTAQASGGAVTPNFGKETPTQGAVLIAGLVSPVGGTLATAQTTAGASQFGGYLLNTGYSGGAATLTDLAWNEVGIMTLTPHVGSISGLGYLGIGDLGSGDGSVLTASANLGRFAPHHFSVSSPVLSNRADLSCVPASSFTYLGEPLRAQMQLTAQAAAGQTTRNYDGTLGYAKLVSSASLGLDAIDITGAIRTPFAARLSVTSQAVSWASGVATAATLFSIARATAPDGPYLNVYAGIAPVDSDSTALASSALNLDTTNSGSLNHLSLGTSVLRYGRLKLSNALGSDQLDLPIPAVVESWSNGFTQNRNDNCTLITPNGVGVASLGNYQGGLNASNMGISHVSYGATVANQGKIVLSLLRPGANVRGSVDLTLDLDAYGFSYLKGVAAGGNFNVSLMPWARATLGLYDLKQPLIYLRENY
ncbi:DUF6701 domain-containing protein [Chitinimonas naiadis]